MSANEVFASYLDVKILAKARRGFTPWKAWHKQWCEIKRLENIENGAELILKTSAEGAVINRVILPRSSTICRIESRSKQYAFGIFTLHPHHQKPLLFLSGSSESDTQKWISLIRKTLSIASYIPVDLLSFHVSLVDNSHSRAARLTGLFGILSANTQEITIRDPATHEDIIKWSWLQFHQFHLQAVGHPDDENTICVFHTSSEFASGPGQICFYSKEAPRLLESLVTRGRNKFNPQLAASQRLSQSEGDLTRTIRVNGGNSNCLRNLSESDDSGVRVSLSSDDSDCHIKNKTSSMIGLLFKTPGGSEVDDEEPAQDPVNTKGQLKVETRIPRGESGVSLASGVYEEIPEHLPSKQDSVIVRDSNIYTNQMVHLYEDPEELLTSIMFKTGKSCIPPPLPPRFYNSLGKDCDDQENTSISTPTKVVNYISNNFLRNTHKYRSNTLPAKDLRRLSQTFTTDSDYMVMTPKNKKITKNTLVPESLYVPMSSIVNLKTKIENCYMVMSGKKC